MATYIKVRLTATRDVILSLEEGDDPVQIATDMYECGDASAELDSVEVVVIGEVEVDENGEEVC